ncbi:hypothetical protein TrispH2_011348, partial [Trichoplax sp. H2]
ILNINFNNLKSIYSNIGSNNINSISSIAFATDFNLKTLVMSYNNFTSISFGLLENLATMTDLNYDSNNLDSIYPEDLSYLRSVQKM